MKRYWVLCFVALSWSWQAKAKAGDLPPYPVPIQPAASTAGVGSAAAQPSYMDPQPGPLMVPPSTYVPPAEDSSAHLTAGAGFYFVKPFFKGNPAFTVLASGISPDGTAALTANATTEFDFDYEVAPRVWLGVVADGGVGLRARFWHFDESAGAAAANSDPTGSTAITSAAPAVLGPGRAGLFSPTTVLNAGLGTDVLTTNTRLKLDVYDLEVTQEIQAGLWAVVLSGGGRYAQISQNFTASLTNASAVPGVVEDSQFLDSGLRFTGGGPTAAIELYRRLGDTPFWLYSNLRGSVLFGHGKQVAHVALHTVPPPIGTVTDSFTDAETARDDVLPIGEFELGIEWSRDCGRFHPFILTALVGQAWFDAGNATTETGTLGFFGFTASAGVDF